MRSTEQPESEQLATLTRYGLAQVCGEDAVAFIHGQLTHDISGLAENEARLAGYCTPEGLLLATMQVWKSGADVWLMMPRDILPGIIERLRIYVLRARAQITDVTDDFAISGLVARPSGDAFASAFSALPETVGKKTESPLGTLIRTHDAFGCSRFFWITPRKVTPQTLPLRSFSRFVANDEDWELGDIEAGLPQIYEASQNRFLPRMLNMELLDGISFTKGCYPGQEFITREMRQAADKRRMVRVHADYPGALPAKDVGFFPGREIFDAAAHEPCAILIRAARRNKTRIDALVVLLRDKAMPMSLRLGSRNGSALHAAPLPYAFPDEG